MSGHAPNWIDPHDPRLRVIGGPNCDCHQHMHAHAVCPDCEPGRPCEAHLMALAELVACANAPETGDFDYPALHAALNRGESLDRDTSHRLLWRVKALELENEKLLKRLDRLHEQMEATT